MIKDGLIHQRMDTQKSFLGSQSKYVMREFNTLENFSNSPHNFVLNSGTHSITDRKSVSNFNFKIDSDGNKV